MQVDVKTTDDHILEAAGLRVRFFRSGDRYAHEVYVLEGGRWLSALVSVEGSPEEDWPASPPFQSLEIERRGGQAVALLVGMAGTSHWSASAQIDPLVPCIHFDVAARVRSANAGPLGSAYRAAPEWAAAQGGPCPLEIEPADGPPAARREGPVTRIAAAASTDSAPRTIRWAYRVRRAPAGS